MIWGHRVGKEGCLGEVGCLGLVEGEDGVGLRDSGVAESCWERGRERFLI